MAHTRLVGRPASVDLASYGASVDLASWGCAWEVWRLSRASLSAGKHESSDIVSRQCNLNLLVEMMA